jgi:hypothetical protein
MALAFVSGATVSDTTGTATTGSLGTTAAGQLIVITVSDDGAGTTEITSITDTYGNTWAKVPNGGTNNVLQNSSSTQMWYAALGVGKAGASHTVTVNWNTAATGRVTVAAQYINGFTGTPTLDKSTGAIGTSTSASPGTTAATTNANEVVVIGVGHAGLTTSMSLGAGYTNLTTIEAANASVGQESKVVAATGTQTGTMGITASRAWGAIIATFYDNVPQSLTMPLLTNTSTLYAMAIGIKTSAVTDNFDDNLVDTLKWPNNYFSAAGYGETGGKGVITLAGGTGGANYAAYVSGNYDATESFAAIQVDAVPNPATSTEAFYQLVKDGSNRVEFYYSGGTLAFRKVVAGAATSLASTPYSAVNHKYWQFREAAGTLYFETSPTGATGSWTAQTSLADPFALTTVQVNIGAGTFQAETSPGTLTFDNFNVLPQLLTSPLIASSNVLYTPTLSQQLLTALLVNTNQLFVMALRQNLVLPAIASTAALYAPIVTRSVGPGSIASTAVLYAPRIRRLTAPLSAWQDVPIAAARWQRASVGRSNWQRAAPPRSNWQ